MFKIISIQRFAERGVVQFIRDNKADAIQFDATLTDDEVLNLLERKMIVKECRKNARTRKS